MNKNPRFTVFTGCMFSQKTSRLLMALEVHKHQKKKIVVFKPSVDTRFSNNNIVTHGGWSVPAISVEKGSDVLKELESLPEMPDVVAVDEAFMISGISDVLVWLYRTGIDVIVSTIELSSQGNAFKEVESILPWATQIEKCIAACTVCGADARFTYKKITDDNAPSSATDILVGGEETYEPRCFLCHPTMKLL